MQPFSGACWLWTRAKDGGGYGRARVDGVAVSVHRAAYMELVGPIPRGLELDHLCRVRHCYNPAHLEPVTHKENVRRGMGGAHWAAKTHCPYGHPYTPENTRLNRDCRECRECHRAASLAYYHRKKAL